MSEQEQDRSEAATPYKLREAQKQGKVAKSQEAIFVAVLAAFLLFLYAAGPTLSHQQLSLIQTTLLHASRDDWSESGTLAWLTHMLSSSMLALAPLFLAIIVAVIASNVAQVGVVFSTKPISPDFDRLNPVNGFKRLFSITLLYNAAKSVFKLVVLVSVLWLVLKSALPKLFLMNQIDTHAHGALLVNQIEPLLFKMLLAILILSLFDIGYTRWDFSKKMRMSRREVKDEHKQREGDPRIRSRIRQLRAEMLKQSRGLRKVADADVLITNPTHLAVAVSYKHGEMPAPRLLSKGAGSVAAKMREMARRHNVPVVQNPPLARAMFKRMDAGEYLPEDLYPMAAKILLWVYAMRDARGQAGGRT